MPRKAPPARCGPSSSSRPSTKSAWPRNRVLAAQARYAAAKESLAAAEESKRLREARHKEGLAPLIEVLDAEAAVQGAHTLILQSLFELRVSRASLDLASGNPIEGVKP